MAKYIDFGENPKFSFVGARQSDNLDDFKNAGYIIKKDEVIVDIDNISRDVINAMIETFQIKTETVYTDRGVHFYFKKPAYFRKSESITPLGIKVEYKKFSDKEEPEIPANITVKRNGISREVLNAELRMDMPDIFKPGSYFDLSNATAGDRNNLLFKQRLKVDSLPQWQYIIKFINDFIIDEPLSIQEVGQICRPVECKAEKDLEEQFALSLVHKFQAIKYGAYIWLFIDGKYQPYVYANRANQNAKLLKLVKEECKKNGAESIKTRFLEEIVKHMIIECDDYDESTPLVIKFKNGYLENGEFIGTDENVFTPYYLDLEYDENAKPCQVVDDYLNFLSEGSKDKRLHIEEALGHIFITDQEILASIKKIFILRGEKDAGKSTLFKTIQKIIGKENCANVKLEQFNDEFMKHLLVGKLVNLGDDVSKQPITNTVATFIKNVASGDNVSIRPIYEQAFQTTLATTMFFSSNHDLKSFEKTDAFTDRIDWITLPQVKRENKKRDLVSQMTTANAKRYWIKLMVEGYMRIYENGELTESELIQRSHSEFVEQNNNVIAFIKEYNMELLNHNLTEIKAVYEKWCEDIGQVPLKRPDFKKHVNEMLGLEYKLKRENGQRIYKFVLPKGVVM